jgi:hypothetical protein
MQKQNGQRSVVSQLEKEFFMSDRVSRRSVFGTLVAAVLALLASKLRAAFGRGGQDASRAAERLGGEPLPLSATSYTYDEFRRDMRAMDRDEYVTMYDYENAGRLVSVLDPEPAEVTTYSYDGQSE